MKAFQEASGKKPVKVESNEDQIKGKRFKFIVEEGELNLQCVDQFEEIFEIKREAVDKLPLTEILDP